MASDRTTQASRRVTSADVLELGHAKGITFSDAQAGKIAIAATSMLESAARLRARIERNDEPAFGFSPPIARDAAE